MLMRQKCDKDSPIAGEKATHWVIQDKADFVPCDPYMEMAFGVTEWKQ